MTCRDCEFLDVAPDKAGRRVVRRQLTYPCTFPVPDVVLPDSVTRYHGFQWPPGRMHMCGSEDGANCPCYKKIEKGTKP